MPTMLTCTLFINFTRGSLLITNRRNIATHQLNCNKKDLHSFIEGLFLFLKNNNFSYKEEDRLKPKNNDTEITPMPQ